MVIFKQFLHFVDAYWMFTVEKMYIKLEFCEKKIGRIGSDKVSGLMNETWYAMHRKNVKVGWYSHGSPLFFLLLRMFEYFP